MNRDKVKEIGICFENCEYVVLKPNMFKCLVLDGITKCKYINCYQCTDGEINENLTCNYFVIDINEIGLQQKTFYEASETLNSRLDRCDIVSITLVYEDGEEELIYVDWDDSSEFWNGYQINTRIDDGIRIVIEKGNKND